MRISLNDLKGKMKESPWELYPLWKRSIVSPPSPSRSLNKPFDLIYHICLYFGILKKSMYTFEVIINDYYITGNQRFHGSSSWIHLNEPIDDRQPPKTSSFRFLFVYKGVTPQIGHLAVCILSSWKIYLEIFQLSKRASPRNLTVRANGMGCQGLWETVGMPFENPCFNPK